MKQHILLPCLSPHNETLVEIARWISTNMPPWAEGGAVIGMSGGIDSSVVAALTKYSFAKFSPGLMLRAFSLPSSINKTENNSDAKLVADKFEIKLESDSIQKIVESFENFLTSDLTPYDKGNMISRIRANILWTLAAKYKSIVMGTGNKDEDYGVGYYTLLGDGAVHMNPIGFLSKRLVRQLAIDLKIPTKIIEKKPSAELEENQTDEGDLGYSYEFVELVLEGINQGFSLRELEKNDQVIEAWAKNRQPKFMYARDVIFDVLNRHEIALKKAKYICPKVPEIKLQYA